MPVLDIENPIVKSTLTVLQCVLVQFILFYCCIVRRKTRYSGLNNNVDVSQRSKLWDDGNGANPGDLLNDLNRVTPEDRRSQQIARSLRSSRRSTQNSSSSSSANNNTGRSLSLEECKYLADVHIAFLKLIHTHLHACNSPRELMAVHSFMGYRSMKFYSFVNDPLFNSLFLNFAVSTYGQPTVQTLMTSIRLQSQVLGKIGGNKVDLESRDLLGVKQNMFYQQGVYFQNTNALSKAYSFEQKEDTGTFGGFPIYHSKSRVYNAPPGLPFVSIINPEHIQTIKNLQLSLKHPHLQPTFDIAFSHDRLTCFVYRPYCPLGSLRDQLFGVTNPTSSYATKYPGYTPLVPHLNKHAAYKLNTCFEKYQKSEQQQPIDAFDESDSDNDDELFITATSTLRVKSSTLTQIKMYGKQILLGMQYLDRVGLPPVGVHTGNVMLHRDMQYITDYESVLLNLKPFYHAEQSRLAPHDPLVVAFACILYELATGKKLQIGKQDIIPNFSDLGRDYNDLHDVLKVIFTPRYRDGEQSKSSYVRPTAGSSTSLLEMIEEGQIFPPPYMLLEDLIALPFFDTMTVNYRTSVIDALPTDFPSSEEVLEWNQGKLQSVLLQGSRSGKDNNSTIYTTTLAQHTMTEEQECKKHTFPPSRFTTSLGYEQVNPFFHPKCKALSSVVVTGLASTVYPLCSSSLLKYYPKQYRKLAAKSLEKVVRLNKAKVVEKEQSKQRKLVLKKQKKSDEKYHTQLQSSIFADISSDDDEANTGTSNNNMSAPPDNTLDNETSTATKSSKQKKGKKVATATGTKKKVRISPPTVEEQTFTAAAWEHQDYDHTNDKQSNEEEVVSSEEDTAYPTSSPIEQDEPEYTVFNIPTKPTGSTPSNTSLRGSMWNASSRNGKGLFDSDDEEDEAV